MKQFNLEEYLKNPSRKVITKDGRNARIICHDAKGSCPVVALVAYENYEVAFNATKYGKIDGFLDLFFATEKHEGWVNIYKDFHQTNTHSGNVYDSKIEAENFIDVIDAYITTVKIEWEK